eukprot:42483-Pyramimonas_sp.AAC.1
MIRRPPRSTHGVSSEASDVYKRQSDMFPAMKQIVLKYNAPKRPSGYDVQALSLIHISEPTRPEPI